MQVANTLHANNLVQRYSYPDKHVEVAAIRIFNFIEVYLIFKWKAAKFSYLISNALMHLISSSRWLQCDGKKLELLWSLIHFK